MWRDIDKTIESEKARASTVLGAIHLAIVAVILLAGIWQSEQAGLLVSDWWQALIAAGH